MSGDPNMHQADQCDHNWLYQGSKRQQAWQCSKCLEWRFDPPVPAKPAERQPLTDEEICGIADATAVDEISCHADTWHIRFARAIEAKILEQFK